MAKTKNQNEGSGIENLNNLNGPDLPEKDQIVDLTKKVKVLIEENDDKHFYTKGDTIECSPVLASKIVNNGWGKIVAMIAMLSVLSLGSYAQVWNGSSGNVNILYQPLTPHTPTVPVASDTVTNTATNYLTSIAKTGVGFLYTTISCNVTKISGTVGGTITLQGSIDGTTFSAIKTLETQTSVAPITAADASAGYHWRLYGNPFTYYRVTWTGTGTMAASFTSRITQR